MEASQTTEATHKVRLVDATTGETVITHTYHCGPLTEQQQKDERGWVLRWRTGHKRRTGHSLRVEREK